MDIIKERRLKWRKENSKAYWVALPCVHKLFHETIERPKISDVKNYFDNNLKNTTQCIPKTKNKGLAGQVLEMLLGIPLSSDCLDCSDGELKLFPICKTQKDIWRPKETIAITMRGVHTPEPIPWEESDLKKKIDNVLFIAYYRDGDNVHFKDSFILNSSNEELYNDFKNDYELITTYYRTNGVNQKPKSEKTAEDTSNSINGKYIQGRTKGQGGAKKTVGFYFLATQFVKPILLDQYMKLNNF